MGWPVEPFWIPFARGLPFLALLAGVALALAATAPARPRARALACVGLAALVTLLALVASLDGGLAPWDDGVARLLRWPALDGTGRALAWPLFPVLLVASLALAAWPLARGRWPEAFTALAAGPGLGGLLVAAKLAHPRHPPVEHPFFGGPMGFPGDAAFALGLALLAAWLARRLRPTAVRRLLAWPLPLSALLGLLPLAAGLAWPSDLAGGWLLAVAWVSTCIAGFHLADDTMAGRGWLGRAGAWVGGLADAIVARGTLWLAGLLAVGIALRLASYWWTPLGIDAFAYAVMARSWLADGTFTMPWGDVHTYLDQPVPSHHYPPLYPVLLSGFYAVLGFSRSATHLAGLATGLAAILVTYLCSRDLYGRGRALAVAAAVAVSPIFVQNTGQAYSENLVLALFVATLWAILRSLEKPWFIALAGLLAGLGYLTKSSMGYFFILAGLGGLAWRLHWKGWKVLKDPAYLTGIALFAATVLAWAWRNWSLFRSWETSGHLSAAYGNALAHPGAWLALSGVALVFYATLGYLVYLGLLPVLRDLARSPKLASEHDSGLWLALGLPLLLTALIDGALWLLEGEFYLANARYVGFVLVPAAWLLARHLDIARRSSRVALVAGFTLLLAGALFFGKPYASQVEAISHDLGGLMADGDTLGFVDLNNHFVYAFVFEATDDGRVARHVEVTCARDPHCPPDAKGPETLRTTWVLMAGDGAGRLDPSYAIVKGTHAAEEVAHPEHITLWRRGAAQPS